MKGREFWKDDRQPVHNAHEDAKLHSQTEPTPDAADGENSWVEEFRKMFY